MDQLALSPLRAIFLFYVSILLVHGVLERRYSSRSRRRPPDGDDLHLTNLRLAAGKRLLFVPAIDTETCVPAKVASWCSWSGKRSWSAVAR